MKKFILAILLLGAALSSNAEIVTVPIPGAPGLSVTVGTGANVLPLQNIQNDTNAVNITTWDDWYNEVPLGFAFPYFGQTFTNSWAATNGYVTFQNPQQSGLGGGCCSGVDLRNTTNPAFNYTIFAVHTDLYSWNGHNQYYLRGNNEMTYGWYNVSQCCSAQGGNSFEIKITSAGTVDTRVAGALVNWNSVTSGMSGNLANGEYYQYYHGQGMNVTPGGPNVFGWNTTGGFTGSDPCLTNPLSSPTCSGYAVAYLNQQCSISALYNPSCPGYAQAFYTQQCTVNQLYDTGCPGYAAAYLTYQCSTNPLYSSTCDGYAEAYFAQQCEINGLYNRECPNYAEAYALANVVVTTPTVVEVAQQTVISTNTNSNSQVAVVADPVVNSVVTSTTTSTSPAVAAPVVTLVSAPTTTTTTSTTTSTESSSSESSSSSKESSSSDEKKEEKKEEKREEKSSSKKEETGSKSSTTDNKPSQPSAREQMVAKRKEAAMQTAVKAGAEAASKLDSATSLAAQIAVQNVVIAAMGYTPGFQAYSYIMPDGNGYKPFSIYTNQKTVDNKRLSAGLTGPSDTLHQQMINQQYKELQ